jgi:hypothetical protein
LHPVGLSAESSYAATTHALSWRSGYFVVTGGIERGELPLCEDDLTVPLVAG